MRTVKTSTPQIAKNKLEDSRDLKFEIIGQGIQNDPNSSKDRNNFSNSISVSSKGNKANKDKIKEPIELSGGYKMPQELYQRKQQKNDQKELNASKASQNSQTDQNQKMSQQEREIFDKLNIKPVKNEVPVEDVDVLQQRIRENYEHDEEVNDLILDNVQYRVEELHEKMNDTLSKHLSVLLQQQKDQLNSLMGSQQRPRNREEIMQQLNQQYSQQQDYVERSNNDYLARSKLIQDIDNQGIDYPEVIVQTYLEKVEVRKGKTNLDECDKVLDVHRNYVNELKQQYLQKRLEEENANKFQLEQEKQKKGGIIGKVLTAEEREQLEFQKEFQKFVKQRKNNEVKEKISRQYMKKDFQTYQALSPNVDRAQKATPQALYQDQNLYNDKSKERQISPKTQQLYESLGYSISEASKSNIRGSQSKLNKNNRTSDRELVNNEEIVDAQSEYFRSNGFENSGFKAANSKEREQKSVEKNERADSKQKKSINDIQKELNMLQIFFQRTYDLNQKKDPQKIQAIYEDLYTKEIDQMDMIKAILQKEQIMEFYNLSEDTLSEEITRFQTQDQNLIKFEEFVDFLKLQRKPQRAHKENNYFANEIAHSTMQKADSEIQKTGGCLLSRDHLNLFKGIFEKMDVYNDLVVQRKDYVEKLRNDVRMIHIMHLPAVFLSAINQTLTVERVIYRIQQEQLIGDEIQKKGKQFMTWGQVLQYLTNQREVQNDQNEDVVIDQAVNKAGMTDDEKEQMKLMRLYSQIKENMDDSDQIDVDGNIKEIIDQTYEKLPKYKKNFVQSIQFIQEIKLHHQYPFTCQEVARFKALKGTLRDQSLEEVIDRMQKVCDEFIDYHEIMSYFTRLGVPKSRKADELSKNKQYNLTLTTKLKDKTEDFRESRLSGFERNLQQNSQRSGHDQEEESIIDGYDSDPETHTYTRGVMPKKASHLFQTQNAHDSSINRLVKRTRIEEDFPDNYQIPEYGTGVNFKLDNEDLYRVDPQRSLSEQRINYYNRALNKKRNRSESQNEDDEKLQITKPKPFEFDERDKSGVRSNSIYARRMREMAEEAKAKDEAELKFRFKPQKIPESVQNRELLKEITRAQEERRKMVQQNSVAITIMNEKPFSFYKRDQEKAKRKTNYQRQQFVFKAKKIPAHVSMNLLERKNEEQEYVRKDRNAKHANWLMSISQLPPRMEKWEQEKKVQELAENMIGQSQSVYNDHTFEPPRAQPIPDFERLQKTFQDNLDRKQKNKRPTEPTPFNFKESQQQPQRENSTSTINKKTAQEKLEEAKKWRDHQPEFMPGSTAKFDQQVKKLREEREQKADEEARQQKELEDMQQKQAKIGPRVKQTESQHRKQIEGEMLDKGKLLNFDEIVESRKKDMAEKEIAWQKQQQELIRSAYDQPLLIERKTRRDKQLEKMRMIDKLNQLLDQNGIKDQDQPFSKQQREILKDIEYLRRAGFGDQLDQDEAGDDIKDALENKKNKDKTEDMQRELKEEQQKQGGSEFKKTKQIEEENEADQLVEEEIESNIKNFFNNKDK